jgi:hypothetical protein
MAVKKGQEASMAIYIGIKHSQFAATLPNRSLIQPQDRLIA